MQRFDIRPRVAAEQPGGAGVGPQQAEQDAEGGRLPGAVGPEEAVHLALLDLEVEPVEGDGGAEGLAQAADLDDGAMGRRTHLSQILNV